ncbi:MAG: hypothetical protein K2G70_05090 [Turicibacter sp.]|nr:hypothetical protein [Turicibacter sp.]
MIFHDLLIFILSVSLILAELILSISFILFGERILISFYRLFQSIFLKESHPSSCKPLSSTTKKESVNTPLFTLILALILVSKIPMSLNYFNYLTPPQQRIEDKSFESDERFKGNSIEIHTTDWRLFKTLYTSTTFLIISYLIVMTYYDHHHPSIHDYFKSIES